MEGGHIKGLAPFGSQPPGTTIGSMGGGLPTQLPDSHVAEKPGPRGFFFFFFGGGTS